MGFKEFKGYRCEYCFQVFSTKRHICKFNPDLKNCFTCNHHGEFKSELEDVCDTGMGIIQQKNIFSDCDKRVDSSPECQTIMDMSHDCWKGYCGKWELIEGYKNKKDSVKNQNKILGKEILDGCVE